MSRYWKSSPAIERLLDESVSWSGTASVHELLDSFCDAVWLQVKRLLPCRNTFEGRLEAMPPVMLWLRSPEHELVVVISGDSVELVSHDHAWALTQIGMPEAERMLRDRLHRGDPLTIADEITVGELIGTVAEVVDAAGWVASGYAHEYSFRGERRVASPAMRWPRVFEDISIVCGGVIVVGGSYSLEFLVDRDSDERANIS